MQLYVDEFWTNFIIVTVNLNLKLVSMIIYFKIKIYFQYQISYQKYTKYLGSTKLILPTFLDSRNFFFTFTVQRIASNTRSSLCIKWVKDLEYR